MAENQTMWGGVLEPALGERHENEGGEVTRHDGQCSGDGWRVPARGGALVIPWAAEKKAADSPGHDPEDDLGDDPVAADEELEELDAEELDGDSGSDEDFPEVDDDLIDLDDEWDEQTEEERHDNPHKFYE